MKNKKHIVAFISAILFLSYAYSKNIFVTNPGDNKDIQPNIVMALKLATNGDMIIIPSGTFIFNKNIVITKFISFKGHGLSRTTLYRDSLVADNILSSNSAWDAMLKFNINKNTSSNIKITGITFKSKKPSKTTGDGSSLATDIGIKMINCLDFIIANCRFENFGNGAISVYHMDTIARGLICKNEFYNNAKGPDGLGLGYGIVVYGENKQWISNPKFGTDNFIFIEDNTFDYHRHAIAAGGCALYVARYNTITNNIIGANSSIHAIDAHGARGGNIGAENYFSTRAIEVYKNSIVNTTFKDGTTIIPGQQVTKLVERAIGLRGCEAVVYSNFIRGYRFGTGITIDATPFGVTYPLKYTTGYLSGLQYGDAHIGTDASHGNGDLFYWANSFAKYLNPQNHSSQDLYNYYPQYFKQDRDFHIIPKPSYLPYIYPHPLTKLITGAGAR